jgi:RNA-binding protein NOB1
MNTESNMHHVVLDSGGIIKGQTQTYHKLGAKFWTITEVLAEIRDMKARERLEMLPVDLEIRTPSEKAMHAVSSFAKQTGDFAALSLVDLKVMALSYDLECQMNGLAFIRESPKVCGG